MTDPTEPTEEVQAPTEWDGIAAKEDESVRSAFRTLSGRVQDVIDRMEALEKSLTGKLRAVTQKDQDSAASKPAKTAEADTAKSSAGGGKAS